MAHLDLLEAPGERDLAALYWWRRDASPADAENTAAKPLTARLLSLAEQAVPATPPIVELPGNRLKANAEARRTRAAVAAIKAEMALDPDLKAALRIERRNALVAVATGLLATAAPASAAVYAAAMHEFVALGFAMAGVFAASFAFYHALRWFLLMRSDELPKSFA